RRIKNSPAGLLLRSRIESTGYGREAGACGGDEEIWDANLSESVSIRSLLHDRSHNARLYPRANSRYHEYASLHVLRAERKKQRHWGQRLWSISIYLEHEPGPGRLYHPACG